MKKNVLLALLGIGATAILAALVKKQGGPAAALSRAGQSRPAQAVAKTVSGLRDRINDNSLGFEDPTQAAERNHA